MELARNLSTRTSAPLPSSTASLNGLRIAALRAATRVYPPLHLEFGPAARVRAVLIPTLHGPQSRLFRLRCFRLPVPVHPRRPVCTQLYAALSCACSRFRLAATQPRSNLVAQSAAFRGSPCESSNSNVVLAPAVLPWPIQDTHGCGGRFGCTRSRFISVRCCIQTVKTIINQNLRRSFRVCFTLIRYQCSAGLSPKVEFSPGDGGVTLASRCLHNTDISSALSTAKLLAASIALQFIFWLIAQCTAAPASSTQTVVIMQNQPVPPPIPPPMSQYLIIYSLIAYPLPNFRWLRPHSMLQPLPFKTSHYSVCNTLLHDVRAQRATHGPSVRFLDHTSSITVVILISPLHVRATCAADGPAVRSLYNFTPPCAHLLRMYPQPVAHYAPNRPLPYGWEALTDASGNR